MLEIQAPALCSPARRDDASDAEGSDPPSLSTIGGYEGSLD